MTGSRRPRALHFGAGNIGRGFIGPLLFRSNYHVVFADINESVIDSLNTETRYLVHILDDQEERSEPIRHVSGVLSNSPDIMSVLLEADIITTSVGVEVLAIIAPTIAKGIRARRRYGKTNPPLNIIACENMVGATNHLKDEVIKALHKGADVDLDLAFMEKFVGFANCSVDRIVPPFSSEAKLDVGVEGFYEWVVHRTGLKGADTLHIQGMKMVDELDAYVERKLFTLNTGHAMLAFLGALKGYTTIDQSIKDEELKNTVHAGLEESGKALIQKHHFDPADHEQYILTTLKRFENPNIKDELVRVSRKPLRKLGKNDRLVGPVLMAREYGIPHPNLLKGIAAAFLHNNQDDDESVQLNNLIKEKGIEGAVVAITGFEEGSEDYEIVLRDYKELQKSRTDGKAS